MRQELTPTKPETGTVLPPAAVRPVQAFRLRLILVAAVIGSLFLHEVGHCVVAWVRGCPAIPTPAKEYLLKPLPQGAQNQVALGGIVGSIVALAGALWWLYRKPDPRRSALLGGTMTVPGFYTLRFFLAGRGHDGAEFQEAQAALGLAYAGHALDWFFVVLFALAAVAWFGRVRPPPTFRLAGRLLLGSLIAFVTLVLVQVINNTLFDRLFR